MSQIKKKFLELIQSYKHVMFMAKLGLKLSIYPKRELPQEN